MFKQRKNKQFGYKPRFQNLERNTEADDFKAQWDNAKPNSKRRGSNLKSLPVMLIALIAVIILMYILNGYMN